jgi:thioredoxin reductase (NADPH)
MRAVIYSKDDCPYCDRAKTLLETKQIEYEEIKVGKDITREEFLEKFPNVRTVPQIYLDESYIGGYDSLVKHFGE